MSLDYSAFKQPVVVRAADAETLVAPIGEIRLLADSHATGGAASTVSVRLGKGAPGARPHRHDQSAEMFYVISGAVRVLCGETVVTATKGDLVVVPPGTAHAFSAAPDSETEILIVITPGVERFEYFRKLMKVIHGQAGPETLGAVQALYDTHFMASPTWEAQEKAK